MLGLFPEAVSGGDCYEHLYMLAQLLPPQMCHESGHGKHMCLSWVSDSILVENFHHGVHC